MTAPPDAVIVGRRRVRLRPEDLIQIGGEGAIFAWGDRAIKLYHHPDAIRVRKLEVFLGQDLARRLPTDILGPEQSVASRDGHVVGFVMRRLPEGALPLRRLSQPLWLRQQGWPIEQSLRLLLCAHDTVSALHQQRVIVGDLNDHNLFFRPDDPTAVHWIDVDSFQFAGFPCPVALETFLDPRLYGVADFGRRPRFTEQTDWYAFAVLVTRLLLLAHPYGGVHSAFPTLQARAQAGVTCLSPDVIYPASARPPASLPDALLDQLERVFGQGERPVFPRSLLTEAAAALRPCLDCGLSFPRTRRACPACNRANRAPIPQLLAGGLERRPLLTVTGALCAVLPTPEGAIRAVTYDGRAYRLHRGGAGGLVENWPLIAGRPGYRLGAFGDDLVVAQAGSRRLLVLRPTPTGAQPMVELETSLFNQEPAFAGTAQGLFRLAGGALLRGRAGPLGYVEEVVGDARRAQTQLWGSPDSPLVAGCYRLWTAHHLFLVTRGGAVLALPAPSLPPARHVSATVGRQHVAFHLRVRDGASQIDHTLLYDEAGRLQAHWRQDDADGALPDPAGGRALNGAILLTATDAGIRKDGAAGATLLAASAGLVSPGDGLHAHPQGLLLLQADRLWLLRAL